tara:strand:+ start:175 stop:402 length:228 start_codon:yes stop_codon:yes gene_type:complete
MAMVNNKKGNFLVIVKDNNIEKAIRIMKTKSTKLNIMKTYRERQRYEKPSDVRIRKAKEGKINLYKAKKKREQQA